VFAVLAVAFVELVGGWLKLLSLLAHCVIAHADLRFVVLKPVLSSCIFPSVVFIAAPRCPG
jgi:hypothetical protein